MEVEEKFDLTQVIKDATKNANQQSIITIEFPLEPKREDSDFDKNKMSLTDYLLLKSISGEAPDKQTSGVEIAQVKTEPEFFDVPEQSSQCMYLDPIVKTDSKSYSCHFCGKLFRRNDHLKNHIRIHTGEKPYVCSYCSRAFNKNHHLKNHIRQHTGERPYQCDICLQRFVRNHHMKKHRSTHNKF